MTPGNKTTITALVAGLIGLAWIAAAQAIDLQWYGQSAFKITTDNGKVILIDPFITKNPKTPEALKDLNKLGKVDLIHYGTFAPLKGTPEQFTKALGSSSTTVIVMNPGDTRKF